MPKMINDHPCGPGQAFGRVLSVTVVHLKVQFLKSKAVLLLFVSWKWLELNLKALYKKFPYFCLNFCYKLCQLLQSGSKLSEGPCVFFCLFLCCISFMWFSHVIFIWFRIMEPLRLEKTFKFKSKHKPCTAEATPEPCPSVLHLHVWQVLRLSEGLFCVLSRQEPADHAVDLCSALQNHPGWNFLSSILSCTNYFSSAPLPPSQFILSQFTHLKENKNIARLTALHFQLYLILISLLLIWKLFSVPLLVCVVVVSHSPFCTHCIPLWICDIWH